MGKLPLILLFCCTLPPLHYSGNLKDSSLNARSSESHPQTKSDTSGLLNLIKADSFKLAIELPSSGVQFYKDGIVFLSQTKNEEKMLSLQLSFGTVEAYYASVRDTLLGKHMVFSPLSSFPYPCEAITFSSDFKTMYFTKLDSKKGQEKIYKATYVSKKNSPAGWVAEPAPLEFCTENANYSHPALSADGKMMVFASDKKGSTGGMDLFLTRNDGIRWSVPESLGSSVNSPGNDFFPFIDSHNNLFFSSDGHGGFGGFDLFSCKFNGEKWEKPVNLSKHINSAQDDIAFTIDKANGRSAFFSRRQKSGSHLTQLFRITIINKNPADDLLTLSFIFNGRAESRLPATAEKTNEQLPVAKTDSGKAKIEPAKPVQVAAVPPKTAPAEKKEVKEGIVYRIQFLSTTTSKPKYKVVVNNKSFTTWEYYYMKAYRQTIGEFSSFKEAVSFQNECRKSGLSQAFVVVFKNNERSLDQALFK